jgi:hypothetical protein
MASYVPPITFKDIAPNDLVIEYREDMPLKSVVLIDGLPYTVYHKYRRGIDDYVYKLYKVNWRGEYPRD